MAQMKPGTRVVRGPDWQMKRQDGGEGHTGTIVYIPKEGSSDTKVTVIWDSGRELRYRAGKDSKYDLRILDNGPAGVKHEGIVCDCCKQDPVLGMRWKCADCDDFDLCTICYMSGKHDISHGFMRIDTSASRAIQVAPRNKMKPKPISGVYKGASVMRGPHWKWKNLDGGEGEEGEVVELIKWPSESYRGGVTVKWKATKQQQKHRLGGEGCVDVIYTEDAQNGTCYLEQLPLVDIVSPGEVTLKNSDKVRVVLDQKHFCKLQEHKFYGGWNDGMVQCMKELGTIVNLLYNEKAVRVQYDDAKVWTVNAHALTRVHSFSQGEAVTILEDINTVRELQEGHGGWNEEMKGTLGKVGRIARIDDDGDLRVKVEARLWIFSPVCCSPLEDREMEAKVPKLSQSDMQSDKADDMEMMKKKMESVAGALAELFVGLLRGAGAEDESDELSVVEAAAKGDLDGVKAAVQKAPDKVNAKHENKTALQLACYEGHVEVVKYLLNHKADVNIADEEGDTALHFAAFGQEEQVMQTLLDQGAKKDVKNKKGQTCLHITIGKGNWMCTRLLVKRGFSPNIKDADGDSPMHDCIIQKRKQAFMLEDVLNNDKSDYAIQNAKGFNVLQWAALKDCRNAVKIIARRKPGMLNGKMAEGFTALHICAANDHVEIGSILLEAKADKNAADNNKRTPLHLAITQSHKRMVELLLTHECQVDAQDCDGNTPLHVAQISRALPDQLARLLGVPVRNDDVGIQITSMMLEAGAKIDIKNKKDQTPVDLCSDVATKEFMIRLAKQASGKRFETSRRSGGVQLPTHWSPMGDETLIKVHLDTSNGLLQKEYQGIKNRFCRTLPQARILRVDRVQNKFQWEHFYLKRRQFEADYGKGCINELDLYHGTTPDIVDVICKNNLDPRLSGERVGTLFGKGTYFAQDAKHSDGYSEPDENKHKFMFQCRVLAGKWALGDPSYKRPPLTNERDKSSRLYDCCVDSTNRPRVFCLFDANQYYPEYVIEYM